MTCEHCVGSVRDAALSVEGVSSASVELETGRLIVTGPGVDPAKIVAAVADAGYAAGPGA